MTRHTFHHSTVPWTANMNRMNAFDGIEFRHAKSSSNALCVKFCTWGYERGENVSDYDTDRHLAFEPVWIELKSCELIREFSRSVNELFFVLFIFLCCLFALSAPHYTTCFHIGLALCVALFISGRSFFFSSRNQTKLSLVPPTVDIVLSYHETTEKKTWVENCIFFRCYQNRFKGNCWHFPKKNQRLCSNCVVHVIETHLTRFAVKKLTFDDGNSPPQVLLTDEITSWENWWFLQRSPDRNVIARVRDLEATFFFCWRGREA